MYSRQDRELRVPHNYGGSIFSSGAQPPTPVEDRTRKFPPPPPRAKRNSEAAEEYGVHTPSVTEDMEACADREEQLEYNGEQKPTEKPVFAPHRSPLSDIGTEEILIIALALIIFGNGKEPELALILLALLFF